ncbi:MAG: hypothetical protein AW07_00351 [Candidatus Accumulibacter sp. SK-11]|nr:MAG: hypothetical protein AW07_00351 [Candidatus Accumulibacter sp. SK-11]
MTRKPSRPMINSARTNRSPYFFTRMEAIAVVGWVFPVMAAAPGLTGESANLARSARGRAAVAHAPLRWRG